MGQSKTKFTEQREATFTEQDRIALELKNSLEEQQQYAERFPGRLNIPDLIYQSFKREEKEPTAQEEITFAPSYLSACGRATYYKKTGAEQTNKPDLPALLKMSWGDVLHDNIQQILVKAGVLESHEIHRQIIYEGIKFNYFYDGVLNYNLEKYIMEIKTVYASGYKSIEDNPKEEHILQTICYMIFEGIDKAVILYAGRDNGYLKQHTLRLEDGVLIVNNHKTDHYQTWVQKMNRTIVLKGQIESGQMPDRDFSIVMKNGNPVTFDFQKDSKKYKSDWRCMYCQYLNLCWQKELEEIKSNKFFIDGKFI